MNSIEPLKVLEVPEPREYMLVTGILLFAFWLIRKVRQKNMMKKN